MKLKFLRVAIPFNLIALSSLSVAATNVYEAVDHPYYYSFNIQGVSSNPGGRFSNAASSSYIRASLDTTARTFAIDQMDVLFTNVSSQFSENVTIGFGQSVPLTFNFRARPFGFHLEGGAPVGLTPGVGGNFVAGSFTTATSVLFDPIIIDYTITNPATGEVATGTSTPQLFDNTPMWATLNVSGNLDASGYPDELLMDRITINAGAPMPGAETITQSISGGSVVFSLSYGYFNINPYENSFEGDNRIRFTLIPEPSGVGLFLMSSLGYTFFRRRNKLV